MMRPARLLRATLVLLALALAACASTPSTRPPRGQSPRPPNVVYILADDLGIGDLGSYGQRIIRTPNLDRLAAEGMSFTRHYAHPVCAPSRAMLLTGRHSGHAPIRGNFELGGFGDDEERGQLPLPADTYTIGHLMQQAGYRTAIVGKWGLGGFDGKGMPHDFGFDHAFGYLDQKQAHNHYPTHLWNDGRRYPLANRYFPPHQRFPDGADPHDPRSYDRYQGRQYALDVVADDALAFIRRNRDRPFFLYFAPTTPHLALQVPDDSLAQYDGVIEEAGPYLGDNGYLPHLRPRAAYAAMITRMDRQVGRIMDEIKALGLDDDTIVMFSSDNGPGDVGGVDLAYFDSTAGLRGHKGQVFEGGIRVPLLVRWPGHVAAGASTALVAANWDMLPTLAELLGRPVPAGVDGISLLPQLLGEPGQARHGSLYWEHHDSGGQQAVRVGRWKGIRLGGKADPDAAIRLYDLETDPGEQHDVAAQHPEIVARIDALMRRSHAPSPLPEWNFTP